MLFQIRLFSMRFIPPALLIVFAIAFFSLWLSDRTRVFLVFMGSAFLLFGIGLFCQTGYWPTDEFGLNTMLSALLYCSGTLAFAEGILRRSGRRMPLWQHVGSIVAITGLIAYFFYIDRNLQIRVYVLNLGLGLIFSLLVFHARFLRKSHGADRILFWLLAAFAAHFILRTLLTAGTVSQTRLDTSSELADFVATPFWVFLQVSSAVLGVAMGVGLLIITSMDVITGLRRERDTDPLTGTFNRRGLENHAGLRKADLECVVLCDIDHFKNINDSLGHIAGDRFLLHVSKTILRTVRAQDLVARIGGEEFVIILPGLDTKQAYKLVERIRKNIETTVIEGRSVHNALTCSFGMTSVRKGEALWDSISRADKALYEAKAAGRNRTVVYGKVLPGAYAATAGKRG